MYLFSILCILYFRIVFVYCFSCFYTSLPTTATGWKPNCSK